MGYRNPRPPAQRDWQGVVPARVVAHDDPKKMGRLQVQFFWQAEGATHWARTVAPHAGPGRGFMFMPEVGDEVAVLFEDGDPERPIVLGAVWNGVQQAPRHGFFGAEEDIPDNNVKRMVTKSGNRFQMVDTPGKETVLFATPNHTNITLTEKHDATGRTLVTVHSDGDIVLHAPEGRVHVKAKYFSREVGDETTAGAAVASDTEGVAASIAPAVFYPAAGTSLLREAAFGGFGMSPGERAIICEAICECNAAAPLSSSGASLKQICVSSKLHARDLAMGYQSTIKSEVSYDMTQDPPAPIMVNGEPTRPHPPNRFPGQKIPDFTPGTGMMRRPDAIIVNNPALPPYAGNVRSVVEIKFPPQMRDREQDEEYRRIGGRPPEHLSPVECGCEKRQEPEPVPLPVPLPAPQAEENHTLRNTLIVGGLAAAALALLPEEAVAGAAYGLLRLGGFLLRGAAAAAP